MALHIYILLDCTLLADVHLRAAAGGYFRKMYRRFIFMANLTLHIYYSIKKYQKSKIKYQVLPHDIGKDEQ